MPPTTRDTERRLRDAEAENDRLRWEAEDRRREENRRADEQERERVEARRRRSPSNRLYNGEISNFREAIDAHIAALRHERNSPYAAGEDEDDVKFRADFDGYIKAAEELRAEYDATVGQAERALFTRWGRMADGSLPQVVGQCGLSGDYSPLAI